MNKCLFITADHQGKYLFSLIFKIIRTHLSCVFSSPKTLLVYDMYLLFFFSIYFFSRPSFSIIHEPAIVPPSILARKQIRKHTIAVESAKCCNEDCSGQNVGTKECDQLCFTKRLQLALCWSSPADGSWWAFREVETTHRVRARCSRTSPENMSTEDWCPLHLKTKSWFKNH